MTFALNDDQKAIRDLARGIFAATCDKDALDKLEAAGGFFSAGAWRALAQAGLAGMAVPEADDGGGLGLIEQCLVLRMVGEHVAPVPVLESAVMAGPAIARFADEATKEQWLPGVLSGEAIGTVALGEPDTRDLGVPTTTVSADGLLTGTKTCVPWLDEAAALLLSATGPSGPGLWLVEKAALGRENAKISGQTATDGQPLAHVVMSGVPAVKVGGEDALAFVLQRGALGRSAMAHGVAKMALGLTSEFCRQREQFGAPIGTFQAVSQRAGDMYIDTQAIELAVLSAAFQLQARDDGTGGDEADSALLVARYFATEGCHRVVAAAQHLHGGMGFDRDYPLHRCFLRARRLELGLGTARESLARLGAMIAA